MEESGTCPASSRPHGNFVTARQVTVNLALYIRAISALSSTVHSQELQLDPNSFKMQTWERACCSLRHIFNMRVAKANHHSEDQGSMLGPYVEVCRLTDIQALQQIAPGNSYGCESLALFTRIIIHSQVRSVALLYLRVLARLSWSTFAHFHGLSIGRHA